METGFHPAIGQMKKKVLMPHQHSIIVDEYVDHAVHLPAVSSSFEKSMLSVLPVQASCAFHLHLCEDLNRL